jgi:hypothetical protein
MSIVTKPLTNTRLARGFITHHDAKFSCVFKVVPATSFELARLAAGDFKSPSYPMQNKDLG